MTELAYPSGLRPGLGRATLSALRDVMQPLAVHRFRDVPVEGLAFHSDEVRPGSLFFAVRGSQDDGTRWVGQALARGAVAVVAREPLHFGVPVIVVDDVRRALADAACHFYDHPSASLAVVGVTGTNGKTTVASLVRQCLQADDQTAGLLGTIGYEFGGRQLPATTTTPDAVRLQGYLREMVDRQTRACVMEVSSHALVQQRVRGSSFRVGVFLNLTQDHLDFHGSMEDYAEAKARLFAMLRPGSVAVLNVDSPWSEVMFDAIPVGVKVVTFGHRQEASFRAHGIRCALDGTHFTLAMPRGNVDLRLPLPGRHNVDNALAAAATAHALGVSELTIAAALERAAPVRGRLEMVGARDGVQVFVDYAHTPDALEKVGGTLRALADGPLTIVFGCGGDRDRGKRPLMARAAARHADRIYLTSDNPRSEDPEAILDDIEAGFGDHGAEWVRVTDRETAIRRAIGAAVPGEVVLIAGKGHETWQVIGSSVVPFDDAEHARRALSGEV